MPALPRAYFDTSVVLKRYFHETGSHAAKELLSRHAVLTSSILPLEVASAFRWRKVMGDIGEKEYLGIVSSFGTDREMIELIEVGPVVLRVSEELIGRNAIRVLDAIHVASALEFGRTAGMEVPFVTADLRQSEIAEQSGLKVVFVK